MAFPVDNTHTPWHVFDSATWAARRGNTPLTLTEDDLRHIRSLNDPVSIDEVCDIYLPLARLLSMHVEATQQLFLRRQQFLQQCDSKTPFIVGIAGSVAVGKSTTARLLQALMSLWPSSPKVDLVTTDGFLFPNAVLKAQNLMERKGFPESYDVPRLLDFLAAVKAGEPCVQAPVYSHLVYDIVEGESVCVEQPDILILEGLNVLQTDKLPKDGCAVPFVSDYFDFSIYIDAEQSDIHSWYIERFMRLRETAFKKTQSFFHKYASINEDEALEIANGLWQRINQLNLCENIMPTRSRADLILHKSADHKIDQVMLKHL